MHLHPAAQILSLALLTILLAQLRGAELLLVAVPLAWLFFRHPEHMKGVYRLARSLRWFFLSILILYLWFTPAAVESNAVGFVRMLPAGLVLGLERITGLLIIVGYSGMLLRLSNREEIISGIHVLLSPFRRLHLDTNRLAVRLGLVLDYVPRYEELQHGLVASSDSKNGKTSWIDKSVVLFEAAIHPPAGDKPLEQIVLADGQRYSLLDLILPVVLVMLVAFKWI